MLGLVDGSIGPGFGEYHRRLVKVVVVTSVCTFNAITNNANLTISFYSGKEQKVKQQ